MLYIGAGDLNEVVLLHEEKGQPSDYLYAIEDFYAIWFEDNPLETYRIELEVQVLESELEKTFAQFKRIYDARSKGDGTEPDPTFFYYGIKKAGSISDPARIDLSLQRLSQQVKKGTDPLGHLQNPAAQREAQLDSVFSREL